MADNHIFPNISFDESDVGPRPIITATGNRIGVVGEFLKGPLNTFVMLSSKNDLVNKLGKTTHSGSLGIQTAMDQGAADFGVIRVMGSAKPSNSYFKMSLLNGASTIAGNGNLVFMSTATITKQLGAGVSTREDVAKAIADTINASKKVAALNATVSGNVVTLQSNLSKTDTMPISLRLVDPSINPRGTVDNAGIVFKDANDAVIPANSITRFSGHSFVFKVEYDQSQLSSVLTITDNAAADGDTLSVQIGSAPAQSVAKLSSSSVDVHFTTATAVAGERVTVTIAGVSHYYDVAQGDTATDIMHQLQLLFANNFSYLDIAANAGHLIISSKDHQVFPAVSVSASVAAQAGQPVGVITPTVAATVKPTIKSAADAAKNLASAFKTLAGFSVTAVDNTLVVKPTANVLAAVPLTVSGTNNFSGVWDKAQFSVQTGLLQSVAVHVMLGAEALVTSGISTPAMVLDDLAKNMRDRQLAVNANIDLAAPNNALLECAFDGKAGDQALFGVFYLVGNSISVFDNGLVSQARSSVPGSDWETLNNNYALFSNGANGPMRGELKIQRRKFVRAQATGVFTNSNPAQDGCFKLTLTGGEIAINNSRVIKLANLANKNVLCSVSGAAAGKTVSTLIVAGLNASDGSVYLQSKNAVGPDEVVIGKYSITGLPSDPNNTTSVFDTTVDGKPVNGDVLRIVAASEGKWSDKLRVDVSSDTTGNITISAQYTDPSGTKENDSSDSFVFNLSDSTALDGTIPYPIVKATAESDLIRVYYVGQDEGAKTAPLYSGDSGVLQNGSDGPPATPADYANGINLMRSYPADIVIAAGQTHPSVRSALISLADDSDEVTGLKVAVLCASSGLTPSQAAIATTGIDTSRAVMVGGWCTYSGRSDLSPLKVPPDGFYAGHLAVTPAQSSPAARSSSPSFKNIVSVESSASTAAAYDAFTKARVEMIIADQVTGVFHCLNGRSLSSDPLWQWISLRRIYNEIRTDIYKNLQFAKSEPNTVELRSKAAATINVILSKKLANSKIAGYQPTKCDSENNGPNLVAQGLLQVDVFFTPVYPADRIKVGIHRSIPVSLTVATGA